MDCGQGIFVKDITSIYAYRFFAQCGGRFLVVAANPADYRNGYMLPDWKAVLRELVALAVPAKLTERLMTVELVGNRSLYVGFPLSFPLSVAGLADLFGVPADEIRAQLEDLAVNTDG
jgi:hypothetical protein